MKCVRWCVYCFWQIHKNGLSYCEQAYQILFDDTFEAHGKLILRKHPNWACGCTIVFMYFHSQPVLIHSSGLSLQFKFFYSFGNQGILVLTNYHELRPFKRDYHLIQFHLTCDVYAIRFTESPSFDVLWHLITVT